MKKNSHKKTVREVKNDCPWFDTDNARLIILCALLGFVGAHKFAEGKKAQGWCFILLDLTVVGIIVTMIWAFFDLLVLTIKKDNKPGNMILGSVFLLSNLLFPACAYVFDTPSKKVDNGQIVISKTVKPVSKSAETVKIEIEDDVKPEPVDLEAEEFAFDDVDDFDVVEE